MKNLKSLLALSGSLILNFAFCQSNSHLTLSDPFPFTGENISFTYNPAGTVLTGQTKLSAVIFILDDNSNPVADVNLKPEALSYTGSFTIPAVAKAFFIKISADEKIDDNDGKGYIFLIYKDKKPVPGAYVAEANMLTNGLGNYFAKIKPDNFAAATLFKKEFAIYPESREKYKSNYYLAMSKIPENRQEIAFEIAKLKASSEEADLILASRLLKATKNISSADSLEGVIKTKFPIGRLNQDALSNSIYRTPDPKKKDSLYHAYINAYPEDAREKYTIQDVFRAHIALAYLNANEIPEYNKYEALVKNKYLLAIGLNNKAYEWAKNNQHLEDAAKYSKQSLEIVTERMSNPLEVSFNSPSQNIKNLQQEYDNDADTYAFVLYKQQKYADALKYEQPVINHLTTIDPDIYENYIQILSCLKEYTKVKFTAEKYIKSGHSSAIVKDDLKVAYSKLNGNDTGYEAYLASLDNFAKNKALEDIAKTMINVPATDFQLKDINGTTVSLKELKGKIVIVDFWATWCGPCKASFPGMQLAVNKYKDDPNIKFLFIDTWENGDKYLDGVKKFIADNKYTFNVLLDEKNAEGRQAKVVTEYGVEGIPTKFIIDKSGNIRFKYVGYAGTPEKLVDEVTNMIGLAGKPGPMSSEAKASGFKASEK